jgi:hypothetical protein
VDPRKESESSVEEQAQLDTLPAEMIQEIIRSKHFSLHEMGMFARTNKRIYKSIEITPTSYTTKESNPKPLTYRQVMDRFKLCNKMEEKIKRLSLLPSGLSLYFLNTSPSLPNNLDIDSALHKALNFASFIGITSSLLMNYYFFDTYQADVTFQNATIYTAASCLLFASFAPMILAGRNDRLAMQNIFGCFAGGFCGMYNGGIYGYLGAGHSLSRASYGFMCGATFGTLGILGIEGASRLGLYAGKYYVNYQREKNKKIVEDLRSEQEKLRPFLKK